MKQKLWLSMLFAVIMALTLIPTTALAAAPSIQIDGTVLKDGENSIGGGTATLDAAAGTLTLDQVAAAQYIMITSDSAFTIEVKGSCSVGSLQAPTSNVALWGNTDLKVQIQEGATFSLYAEGSNNIYASNGSLTVSGPGKLIGDSVAGSNGAYPNLAATGDVTLKDGLTAALTSEWHGVYTEEGNIAVQSANVNITAAGVGLFAQTYDNGTDTSVTLENSTVTIDTSSGKMAGVFCAPGDIVVDNTRLTATTNEDPELEGYSLYADGNITIKGSNTVINAEGGIGISAEGGVLTIEGGTINIHSADVALLGWDGVTISGGKLEVSSEEESAILGRGGPVSITGSANVTATNYAQEAATIRNVSDGGIFLDAPVTANNTQGGKPFLGVRADQNTAITFGDGFSVTGAEVFTQNGPKNAQSWLIPSGGDGSAPLTGSVTVCDHVWGSPVWNWAKDYSSATAAFTCSKDPLHTQTVTATVSSQTTDPTCGADGKTVYTASVSFEGVSYTDQKTVVIPATGKHTYSVLGQCTVCGAFAPANPMYPNKPSNPDGSAELTKPSEDEDKENSRNDDNPNTGDSSLEGLRLVLLLTCATGLAGVVDYKAKRKYSK